MLTVITGGRPLPDYHSLQVHAGNGSLPARRRLGEASASPGRFFGGDAGVLEWAPLKLELPAPRPRRVDLLVSLAWLGAGIYVALAWVWLSCIIAGLVRMLEAR